MNDEMLRIGVLIILTGTIFFFIVTLIQDTIDSFKRIYAKKKDNAAKKKNRKD